MATIEQLKSALVAAHTAGDTDSARKLAAVINQAQSSQDFVHVGSQRHVGSTLPAKHEASLGDKVVGVGETGLALATGATGGAMGQIGGTLMGLAQSIIDGTYGTNQGAESVAASAERGAQALTYAPRTQEGQQMTQAAGEALAPLAALMPATAELGMAGQSLRTAAPLMRQGVAETALPIAQTVQKAAEPVVQAVKPAVQAVQKVAAKLTPEKAAKASPEQLALMEERKIKAESLPEPINLTEGQQSREFGQQQFERETAKQPELGAPLRERFAQQQAATSKNFDLFLDSTGAQAQSHLDTGNVVGSTIQGMFKNDKAKVNTLYKEAEKAGEMEAPVTLDSFVQHLNESAPEAEVANVLKAAKQKAVALGVAVEDESGNLIAQPVTLKTAATLRQSVNASTNFEPTNIRQSALMKGAIDESTDSVGGAMYQKARQARVQLAKDYQNVGIIKNIIGLKKGTDDRAIAAEHVFNKSILTSSVEDVSRVKNLLLKGGGEGTQAWNELRGATIRHIKDQATKGISRDEAGNAIISPSQLDKVVKSLDSNGKLDIILGKDTADKVRVLNDVSKDIFTSPPGSVNASGTAAALMAAMDMIISGSAGVPAPIMSSIRMMINSVKDKRIKARVSKALGDIKPKQGVK